MGCSLGFELVGKTIVWRGEGLTEEGIDKETGEVLVQVSPKYFRPTEVETLLGDATKIKAELGWKPEIMFKQLIYEMLEYDMKNEGLTLPESAKAVLERKGDIYCTGRGPMALAAS